MTLAQLRARAGRPAPGTPQRPTFHHLLTVTRGTLWHTVDFTGHALTPGRWLWVRPGQVQQWGPLDDVDGTLVLFQPDFLPPDSGAARLDDPYAPIRYEPTGDAAHRLTDAIEHLARAFTSPGELPLEVHQTVLRHLLAVLVLRLAHLGTPSGSPAPEPNDTFLRLRDAVERDFARTRRLEDYARALGYSTRTLSRATQAAAGVNAKEFIDRRVVLQARRLLAHSDDTAAQIAARLGFTSATNFSKYFHQRTGTTPIAFREAVQAGNGDGAAASLTDESHLGKAYKKPFGETPTARRR
ncbi:AraC family transcriptional regulator [Actinoplanes sp. N902-109]|uniref:helix-turn-helix domain-containing protein n=1 Tax=Actinoplanes sp. (strain N902-109) TaxID=649831 RepID=UPI001E47DC64|nr:AraC family transcriptional regulator [Actinoplanes sp. N902-109]